METARPCRQQITNQLQHNAISRKNVIFSLKDLLQTAHEDLNWIKSFKYTSRYMNNALSNSEYRFSAAGK
jgi:hypothetical protein